MRVAKQALTSATNSDFMLEALKQIAPRLLLRCVEPTVN